MDDSTANIVNSTDSAGAEMPERRSPGLRASNRALVVTIPLVLLASALDMVVPPAGIPVAVLLIWIFLRRTGGSWAELGLGRPRSWGRTIAAGIGLAIVLNLFTVFALKPFLEMMNSDGADLTRFEAMRGNIGMLAMYLAVSWTTAGFGEEIIWRGFIMSGVAKLLGGTRGAWIAGLGIMGMLFGLLHLYQGPAGIISTGLVGVAFGFVYLASGRNLWITIIAHGLMNTFSFLLLFAGYEI